MSRNVSRYPQRILSLFFPRLLTDRLERLWQDDPAADAASQPSDPARRQDRGVVRGTSDENSGTAKGRFTSVPLAVSGKRLNAERILAVNAAAESLGLRPGVALAEARAMHPDLRIAQEASEDDAKLLERLADWSTRYTPLVALDPPDGLILDITGCAHLHGGEPALLDDLALKLNAFGFQTLAAVAGTIGTAWAAARFSNLSEVASGKEQDFLSPLPLSALRLSPDLVATLARVGLKRVHDILDLPNAPIAARFGAVVRRQLDRALGHEAEPLTLRLPVSPYLAEQRFADPITREEDVLAVTERLAGRLARTLETRGEGARQLELALFRTDGVLRRVVVGTSRPLRSPSDIRVLFAERLAAVADAFDPGFGFDLARLSVMRSEPCAPEQIGFGETDRSGQMAHLIDRLSARLGPRRVLRPLAQDSHIPELAAVLAPAQRKGNAELGWEALVPEAAQISSTPRPLRLLVKPEPIEALASVPDGPPIRFRWRRALHEVAAAEGPERIEGAWWSEEGGPARDYFRIEDRAGLRFWIFRAGLYRDCTAPCWFMHGLFA